MLFPSDRTTREIERLMGQLRKTKRDHQKLLSRMLELDPFFSAAYVMMCMMEAAANRLDKAEEYCWKALELSPTSYFPYLEASGLQKCLGNTELSDRLLLLAIWKISFEDEVPEDIADRFRPGMPEDVDPLNPDAYEELALDGERTLAKPMTADVERRLRPYILLNKLMIEADDALTPETMRGILEHADECLPILRGAMYDWARELSGLSLSGACMVIALLGEIGGSGDLEELLEVSDSSELFAHVHWSIHRIAERHPEETVSVFRKAIANANTSMRCAIGEQLYLMQPMAGMKDVLAGLLFDFHGFGAEPNSGHLLLTVVHGLRKLGESDLADALLARYTPMVTEEDQEHVRQESSGPHEYLSRLEIEGITGLDIEEVCIERVLMEEEEIEDEDAEEDEFDEDEVEEDEDDFGFVEPVHVEAKPGRNDPCWCGSGKKYKKCHLAEDEAGGQAHRHEPPRSSA
jgi:uncharacterized protein YchJ